MPEGLSKRSKAYAVVFRERCSGSENSRAFVVMSHGRAVVISYHGCCYRLIAETFRDAGYPVTVACCRRWSCYYACG